MVGWDNTARRPHGATIFSGSTPEAYERWLRQAVESVGDVREEENYLFIVAWNEWAEGNHLEPDQRYGRAYLEATKAVLLDPPRTTTGKPGELRGVSPDGQTGSSEFDYVYPFEHESAVANAAGLIGDLNLSRRSTVVDLGAGTAVVSHPLRKAGVNYHGLDCPRGASYRDHRSGWRACHRIPFDALAQGRGTERRGLGLQAMDRKPRGDGTGGSPASGRTGPARDRSARRKPVSTAGRSRRQARQQSPGLAEGRGSGARMVGSTSNLERRDLRRPRSAIRGARARRARDAAPARWQRPAMYG